MIEIPIAGLLTVIGIFVFIAATMWIIHVNVELEHRGELADYNVEKTGMELMEIKKRLTALENKKQ